MSEEEIDFGPPRVIRRKREPVRGRQEEPKKQPKKLELSEIMEKIRKDNETRLMNIERPLPPIGPDQPHDSAYVHSALKEKHTLGVLPTLNTDDKGNTTTYITVALLILSVFSAWGVAYEAQVSATPHVNGSCPAPAVIEKGGCFTVETSTGANGATVTTLVPAGHLNG